MSSRLEKLLVSFALQATVAGGFFVAERYAVTHATAPPSWLLTPLDAALPLVPWTAWFYVSWYPVPLGILLAERAKFRHASLAIFTAFVLCMVGYLLLPMSISRPPIDPSGSVTLAVLQTVYAVDAPVNLFPSFHAAVAVIVLLSFLDVVWLRYPLVIWTLGVGASCVLTKQHYVLDVVAGLLVGWLAFGLARGVLFAPAGREVVPSPAGMQ